MKLKLSLKNTAKPGLLFSLGLYLSISLSGCLNSTESTYKEKNIPDIVKQICKDEYNLEVITKRTPNTLWIYAPLTKMLHPDYATNKDKIFAEEMKDKLRNILNTVGRVLISVDQTPEFFALLASDINIGLDYSVIGNATDIKKSYAGYIPWTEASRRYVIKFKIAPQAIEDKTGEHLEFYDIRLADFLADQIAQRIEERFLGENLKPYFKVEKCRGEFLNRTFLFEYYIEEILKPEKEISVLKEVLNIITYCIKTYEFKNFSSVWIKDLITQDKLILRQAEIWARPMP